MCYGLCIVCIMICAIYLSESPLIHLSMVVIGPLLILASCTHKPHNITTEKYNYKLLSNQDIILGGKGILTPFKMSGNLKPDIFDLKPRAGHRIKPNCNHMPADVLNIFKKAKPVLVSHIDVSQNLVNKPEKFSRIISNDSPTLLYQRTRGEFKRALHWGQLKLMLTEIEFLTLALEQYNLDYADQSDEHRPPFVMVYAGAAPGHHTQYLSTLFPQVHFELYDPNDFAIDNSEKIKIHIQFFTNSDAKYWANRSINLNNGANIANTANDNKLVYLVFCTDIRTEPATDDNVRENMKMQHEWWTIMNPNLSMFKFRLPWEAGQTPYPEGQIYIQPYPGPTSTETRLIVKRDATIINYDNEKYEQQLFYHNNVMRKHSYALASEILELKKDPTIPHDHVDSCYDCTAFIFIVLQYVQLQHRNTTLNSTQLQEKIKFLIIDIQANITFGKHSIHTQTVRHINEALEKLRRSCYVECNNLKCTICKHQTDTLIRQWKGESKATLHAYNAHNAT